MLLKVLPAKGEKSTECELYLCAVHYLRWVKNSKDLPFAIIVVLEGLLE
jgi:hypothetical protein